MSASRQRLGQARQIGRIAIEFEVRMWTSLFQWILRRPVAEPGATPFGYSRRLMPIFAVFIAVSAIEIPIIDLILPWKTVRIIVAALGVYGLVWMLGLLAIVRVTPHVVGESGLRVRGGSNGLDVTIPWDHITSIHAFTRTLQGKDMQIDHASGEAIISIGVLKETNVDITFGDPTILELPRGDTEPLRALRIAVDDPDAMVSLAREHLALSRAAARRERLAAA